MPRKQQVCKHFRSKGGCRKGANCRFLHELAGSAGDEPRKDENGREPSPTDVKSPPSSSDSHITTILSGLKNVNDSLIQKLGSQAGIIEELRKQNSEVQRIAANTASTITFLIDKLLTEMNSVTERNEQLLVEAAEAKRALHSSEQQLLGERRAREKLDEELKASRDLVALLLRSKASAAKGRGAEGASATETASSPSTTSQAQEQKTRQQQAAAEEAEKERQQKKLQKEAQKQRKRQEKAAELLRHQEIAEKERLRLIKKEKLEALQEQERAGQDEKQQTSLQVHASESDAVKQTEEKGQVFTATPEQKESSARDAKRQSAIVPGRPVRTAECSIVGVKKPSLSSPNKRQQIHRPSSQFLCAPNVSYIEDGVSPIFNMLQDPRTLDEARKLLQLESEMVSEKQELSDLEKSKNRCNATIAKEQARNTRYEEDLKNLDKEYTELQGIWGLFNAATGWFMKEEESESEESDTPKSAPDLAKSAIRAKLEAKRKEKNRRKKRAARAQRMKAISKNMERIEKLKEEIPARISSLETESREWDESISAKSQEISELRTMISELKGGGKEDDRFHIDGSRDERELTFLMVATLNNDIDTARLCFQLGADAKAKSPEGFTAMLFAYVFKIDAMVSLIALHGGTYPEQQVEMWNGVTKPPAVVENPIDWDTTLRIARRLPYLPKRFCSQLRP